MEHQSGFRKQYSCETAIQPVIDEWKLGISEGNMIGIIFIDLKRAFETVYMDRTNMELEETFWNGSDHVCKVEHSKFDLIMNGLNLLVRNIGYHRGLYQGPCYLLHMNHIVSVCPYECMEKNVC